MSEALTIAQEVELVSDLKLIVEAEESLTEIKRGIYGRLVKLVIESENMYHTSFADSISSIEEKLREQGVTAMPSAFRSAKSVILGAKNANVSLLDSHANPRGKSDVEAEVKNKTLIVDSMSGDTVFENGTKIFKELYNFVSIHEPTLESGLMDLWADFDALRK